MPESDLFSHMRRPSQAPEPLTDGDWLVALHASCELAHPTVCRLAALGAGAARRIAADPEALAEARLPARTAALLDRLEREGRELAAGVLRRAADARARVVTLADPEAPAKLRHLALPPPLLYVRGTLPDAPAVAVVGARRASPYGLEVARWVATELVAAGVTVVSGFALGIDAAAHRAALAAGGRTVAVLGCGIDVDYPRGHRGLGKEIAASGALVTEFPPGAEPVRWQFPVRNRLIAALAGACVVVEAAPRSGSLVTARLALEIGREVLAVPGRVTDELALGTNALVADGARPLLDPADVLEALGLEPPARKGFPGTQPREPAGLDADAQTLWRACSEGSANAEALAARAGVDADRALAALLALELGGYLRRAHDGRYEIAG